MFFYHCVPLRKRRHLVLCGFRWFWTYLDRSLFGKGIFLNTGGPENCQIIQGIQWQFKSTWNSFWWNLCENNTPRLWDEKKKLKISALEIWPSGNINLKYQTVVQVKEKHSILEDLVSRQPVVVLWWRYISPSLSQHLSHTIVILNIMRYWKYYICVLWFIATNHLVVSGVISWNNKARGNKISKFY